MAGARDVHLAGAPVPVWTLSLPLPMIDTESSLPLPTWTWSLPLPVIDTMSSLPSPSLTWSLPLPVIDDCVVDRCRLDLVVAVAQQRHEVVGAVAELDLNVAGGPRRPGRDRVGAVAGLDVIVAGAGQDHVTAVAQRDVVVAVAHVTMLLPLPGGTLSLPLPSVTVGVGWFSVLLRRAGWCRCRFAVPEKMMALNDWLYVVWVWTPLSVVWTWTPVLPVLLLPAGLTWTLSLLVPPRQ